MFKITITPPSHQKISKEFNQNQVVIGFGSESEYDLTLPEYQTLGPIIEIVKEDDTFQIHNVSGDKNIFLNGAPLNESIRIEDGDLIEIESNVIIFEIIEELSEENQESYDALIQKIEESLPLNIEESPKETDELVDEIDSVINQESKERLETENFDPTLYGEDTLSTLENQELDSTKQEDLTSDKDKPLDPEKDYSIFDELLDEEEEVNLDTIIERLDPSQNEDNKLPLEINSEVDTSSPLPEDLETEEISQEIEKTLDADQESLLHEEEIVDTSLSTKEEKPLDEVKEILDSLDSTSNPSEAKESKSLRTKKPPVSLDQILPPKDKESETVDLENLINEVSSDFEEEKNEVEEDLSLAPKSTPPLELLSDQDIDALLKLVGLDEEDSSTEDKTEEKTPPIDLDKLIEEAEKFDINELLIDSEKKKQEELLQKFGVIFADEKTDTLALESLNITQASIELESTTEEASDTEEGEKESPQEVEKDKETPLIVHSIFDGIDFDETPLSIFETEEDGKKSKYRNAKQALIRKMLTITSLLLVFFIICGGLYYTYLKHAHKKTEITAARALCDVSMSFLKTRLKHSSNSPTEINPKVLIDNLNKVIPETYITPNLLNSEGQLETKNYSIEFFSSSDLSNFLFIAQAKDSIANTLVPQKTFVVSSQSLTLRVINSITPWATLLNTTDDFDKLKEENLLKLLMTTTVTPLSSLDDTKKELGFSPPKQLEKLYPGAQNLIYNAPRYYLFGTPFLDAVSTFSKEEDSLNSYEVNRQIEKLQSMQQALYTYENLVLYNEKGMNPALDTYYNVIKNLRNTSFLFGYLKFNRSTRYIVHSELITYQELTSFAEEQSLPSPDTLAKRKEVEYASLFEEVENLQSGTKQKLRMSPEQRKINKEIFGLSKQRQNDLQEVLNELDQLVTENKKEKIPNFQELKEELTQRYKAINEVHKKLIETGLDLLYAEYETGSKQTNLPYLHETIISYDLEDYMSDKLKEQLHYTKKLNDALNETIISEQIERTVSLENLSVILEKLNKAVNQKNIPDPIELASLKSAIHQQTMNKLNTLLLNVHNDNLPPKHLLKNNLLLNKIFTYANITEKDEQEYFLTAFDRLMQEYYVTPSNLEVENLKNINENLLNLSVVDPDLTQEDKQVLAKEYNEEIEKLSEKSEEIIEANQKISKIPLESLYSTDSEEKQAYSGRLGQQILVQASQEPTSPFRDKQLFEAIYLLKPATKSNRLLWGDILQARKFLSETPKNKIYQALNSNIGFNTQVTPSYVEMRQILRDYITEKENLINIKSEEQFIAQLDYFKKIQLPNLQKIKKIASHIEKTSLLINQAATDYTNSLKEFLEDYETAKKQGFFIAEPRYQNIMLSRLKKQLYLLEYNLPKVLKLSKEFSIISKQYIRLADEEIEKLKYLNSIDSNDISTLLKKWSDNTFPSSVSFNMKNTFKRIFSIQVSPLP
jgi:uncharacterized ubiquitin-like protein YukD